MAGVQGMKRQVSALDGTWLHDKQASKMARPSGDTCLAGKIRKAIYDNVKMRDVSPEALDGRIVNGVTMREQIEIDKRKNDEKKGSIKMGSTYWSHLRCVYRSKASAAGHCAVRPSLGGQGP